MVQLIVLEGNIGSGKTTFLEYVSHVTRGNPSVVVLEEPVDVWQSICNKDGTSVLELFYREPSKHAFAFQMMAYISRLSLLNEALKSNYPVIICERSLLCDREVFARMLSDDKIMTDVEYQIYLKWFDEFSSTLPHHNVVYLRTNPEVAHQRIALRARPGEQISLEYLQKCHQYHESWLCMPSSCPVGVCSLRAVDADVTGTPEVFKDWYGSYIQPLIDDSSAEGA